MLPHLRGRPLMPERHPDGLGGPTFMQKNTPEHYPEWIRRVELAKEGGTVRHTVCDDTATLLHLADQASIALHRRLSRADSVDHADRLVFDLDPADAHPDRLTTAVAPFTVRPRPGAPVATPITWDQLNDPELHARG